MKLRHLLSATSLLLVITPVSSISQPEPAPSVVLDDFLRGVDDQCRYGEALDQFWNSLVKVDEQGRPTLTYQAARDKVPAEIRPSLGQAYFKEQSASYFSVYVPVSGTWRGVRVDTLGFIIGNESGMHSLAVIFQDSPKHVKKVFGPQVLRAQKKIAADVENENPASIELVTDKDKIMLVCDDSM